MAKTKIVIYNKIMISRLYTTTKKHQFFGCLEKIRWHIHETHPFQEDHMSSSNNFNWLIFYECVFYVQLALLLNIVICTWKEFSHNWYNPSSTYDSKFILNIYVIDLHQLLLQPYMLSWETIIWQH